MHTICIFYLCASTHFLITLILLSSVFNFNLPFVSYFMSCPHFDFDMLIYCFFVIPSHILSQYSIFLIWMLKLSTITDLNYGGII